MTYATHKSPLFVPDPKRCAEHWTFCAGEVQCLLEPEHKGKPCEFMLAGKRVLDPRVDDDKIPEFEHDGRSEATFVGVEPDHRAEDAIADAAVEVVP